MHIAVNNLPYSQRSTESIKAERDMIWEYIESLSIVCHELSDELLRREILAENSENQPLTEIINKPEDVK